MILHKNILEGIIDALQTVFNERKYADQAIEAVFKKNKKWGARDRGLAAESIYDIIRWKRLYTEAAGVKDFILRGNCRLTAGVYFIDSGKNFKNFSTHFPELNADTVKAKIKQLQTQRVLAESIPDWLDELGQKELGAEWERELKALNNTADVILRANTLKCSAAALRSLLNEESIEAALLDSHKDALILNKRQNIFRTKAFHKGQFEVQDASSQLVAPFLKPEPGMRIIDACAGAGGKALHLAALMENKGKILALDTENWKLGELKKRARRNGADIIETRPITSTKVIKRLNQSADRVLLDVPCSGLGVLRRNPDAKWKLQPDYIESLRDTQAHILRRYAEMVKPGGMLVYATCSILPSENQRQVEGFLNEEGNVFKLLEQKYISPAESGFDGFYMARLHRIKE